FGLRRRVHFANPPAQIVGSDARIRIERKPAQRDERRDGGIHDERRGPIQLQSDIFFVLVLRAQQASASAARGCCGRRHENGEQHYARPGEHQANDILKFPSPMSTPRLYLIDGSSQMYRAYHAIRGLTGPDGKSTNAVYGFVTMLRKLINDHQPQYIAASFDLAGPTFRSELATDYKANRTP